MEPCAQFIYDFCDADIGVKKEQVYQMEYISTSELDDNYYTVQWNLGS
jgi:hypothetical protein